MTKKIMKLAGMFATTAVLALGGVSANAVTTYSETFQGITFTTYSVDGNANQMQLRIAGTGTGDWTGIGWLRNLELKSTGIGTVTGGSLTPGSATWSGLGLNANGCGGGNGGSACFAFSPVYALTGNDLFTINLLGDVNMTNQFFHVKVNFLCAVNATDKCGSNYSQDVDTASSGGTTTGGQTSNGTHVPEPSSSLVLLGLGLLGLGFARRLKQTA